MVTANRAVSGDVLKYRMKAGLSYDDAISAPLARQAGQRWRLVPRASAMVISRLNEVRSSLEGAQGVLAKRPRDVKAKARLARIAGELAFLESLIEPRRT